MNADYEDFKYRELTEEIIKIEIRLLRNFELRPEVRHKAFDNSERHQIYRISNPDLSA